MDIDFKKGNGLVPAIVQDATTSKVLMMAYMNKESLNITRETGRVTFYSRSQKKIWTKGETSGNYLQFVSIKVDCDRDTLLIRAIPAGAVCHKGDDTCWAEINKTDDIEFIPYLEEIIESRKEADPASSYTARLFGEGTKKISQKLGEEAVELILEAMDKQDDLLLEESADLIYHFLVLLNAKGYRFKDVISVLQSRHKLI